MRGGGGKQSMCGEASGSYWPTGVEAGLWRGKIVKVLISGYILEITKDGLGKVYRESFSGMFHSKRWKYVKERKRVQST
jgi:hypothetical protein